MKIIVYQCDRCGARVENAYMMMFGNEKKDYPDLISDEKDFCSDCIHEIAEFAVKKIRKPVPVKAAKTAETGQKPEEIEQKPEEIEQKPEEIEQKPEQKEQKTKQSEQKPKIDVGKICSLSAAGWSISKIAEEMKLGIDDVYDVLIISERHGKIDELRRKTKPLEKWCTGEGDDVLTKDHFGSESVILKE